MAVEQRTGEASARLLSEKERWVSKAVATSPIFVERAHGARIVDVDGREYVDFVGGIGTVNGGHTPQAGGAPRRHPARPHPPPRLSIPVCRPGAHGRPRRHP